MTDSPSIASAEDTVIADAAHTRTTKNFAADLPPEAALTHMGFYLGWVVARGMTSQRMEAEHAADLMAFRDRLLTGPQLIGRLGGLLHASQFNEEARQFTLRYYTRAGRFITDYVHAFTKPITQARSMYVVADTWENQDHLSALLDQRFGAWQVYPPAAYRIFGEEVGVGSYQDLETVTQMALLVAAKALKLTRICRPFIVFLTPSDEVRVPQVLSHNGRNIHVMNNEGVAESVECLREGLKLRTVKAFATARLQSDQSSTPASSVEVIAQHFKSGPHRVIAPYVSDATTGVLTFERPMKIADATPSV